MQYGISTLESFTVECYSNFMITLTGATGHLGQAILRQLDSRGDEVSVVIRDGSDTSLLEGHTNSIYNAPLENKKALVNAFKHSDTVIHSAAMIDIRKGFKKQMWKVNVEGTKNVLEACIETGVKKLIYISSIEAFDLKHTKRRPVREDFALAEDSAVMEYGETKAAATKMIIAAGMRGDINTVSIAPTGIIGPWDFKYSLFTSLVQDVLKGKTLSVVPGGFDYVDVRDVAGAVIAAIDKGRSGELYLVSGEYATINEIYDILEKVSGTSHRRISYPLWLIKPAAATIDLMSRIFNFKPIFTSGSIDILQTNALIDSAKAAEELGFKARPIEDSLKDMVNWLSKDVAINPEPLFT